MCNADQSLDVERSVVEIGARMRRVLNVVVGFFEREFCWAESSRELKAN
jgi:hypothetical protein